MTQTNHTPGPWELTFGEYDAAIHTGGTIATVDDTMRAWKANARLIAAAPDLLTALETTLPELICTIQEVIDNDGSPAWIAEAQAKVAAARRAITKAKGE